MAFHRCLRRAVSPYATSFELAETSVRPEPWSRC